MSVRSRGRYVPRPAPLTARKLRSPQDLNRRRPLARPIPTGPPRRSMFASTTRPVRHSTPLPLSIVARPHEAGLIRSWRADSLAFVWLDPGITPCCKSRMPGIGSFGLFFGGGALSPRPLRFLRNSNSTRCTELLPVAVAQPMTRAAAGSERWQLEQTRPGRLVDHAVEVDRA